MNDSSKFERREALLRLPAVLARLGGMSRSWWYARRDKPRPLKIGHASLWRSSDIDRYIQAHALAAGHEPGTTVATGDAE